jgi:hypothetical protein
MQDLLDRTKLPPVETKQMSHVNTKDGCHTPQRIPPKKRTLTHKPETYRKIMRGPMKDLALGETSRSGQGLEDALTVRRESPWETYIKVYECELAGHLDVAIPRVRPERLVAIRTIRGKAINQMLHLFKTIRHSNILSPRECFLFKGSVFILHDNIPVSLDHIVACKAYLNEVELAANRT